MRERIGKAEAASSRWQIRPWHTNAVLIALGLCLLQTTRMFVSEYEQTNLGQDRVAAISIGLYALALLAIWLRPANVDRWTLRIILAVAILCRLVTLFPEPFLSSDVYRYAWDGVVQHAGINPYRYVPEDPALTFLRKPYEELFANMNRRDYAPTIYPPVAQMMFYLITSVSATVTAMKTAMILFEGLTLYALWRLLHALGLRQERLIVSAWCPMLSWEIGGSGHLDAAAMAFIALALLFRLRRQDQPTGVFLGLAFLTKLYPLLLLPILYRRRGWRVPAIMAGMTVAAYAVYASAGKLIFGFLGGYAAEEGMESGQRFFLLGALQQIPGLQHLPAAVFLVLAAAVFGSISLWAWRQSSAAGRSPTAFLKPAFGMAFAAMLLFSPRYAWYVAWLIPFCVLMPNLTVLTYVCATFYLRTDLTIVKGAREFHLDQVLYSTVLVAFLLELLLRRHPSTRSWFKPLDPS